MENSSHIGRFAMCSFQWMPTRKEFFILFMPCSFLINELLNNREDKLLWAYNLNREMVGSEAETQPTDWQNSLSPKISWKKGKRKSKTALAYCIHLKIMQTQNREVLRELKEGGVQIFEVSGTAAAESETLAKRSLEGYYSTVLLLLIDIQSQKTFWLSNVKSHFSYTLVNKGNYREKRIPGMKKLGLDTI